METRKSIFQCGAVLLAGHLLLFWVLYFSVLDLPAKIPGTPLNIDGLAIIVLLIFSYLFFFKRILRRNPEGSLISLIITGGLANFFAEIVFQLIREATFPDLSPSQHIFKYLIDILTSTAFSIVIAFLVAYQLKHRRLLMLLVYIVIIIMIVNLVGHLL